MEDRIISAFESRFRKQDLAGALDLVERRLRKLKPKRFASALSADFTNAPQDVLKAINRFIRSCDKKFRVEAVYFEMNGFFINPNRWYFDSFGYDRYLTQEQEDDEPFWMDGWRPGDWPTFTLKGMESVQKDFKWYHSNEIYNTHRSTSVCTRSLRCS